MSKFIKSSVPEYPGEVGLSDPLTLPQLNDWIDATSNAQIAILANSKSAVAIYTAFLPGILKCVDIWKLTGLPEHPAIDSFPASPAKRLRATLALLSWLTTEIVMLQQDAEEIPNA